MFDNLSVDEKRAYTRISIESELNISKVSGSVPVLLLDFSMGGMKLYSSMPCVRIGEFVSIIHEGIDIFAQVVRVGQGDFSVEYDKRIDKPTFLKMLSNFKRTKIIQNQRINRIAKDWTVGQRYKAFFVN